MNTTLLKSTKYIVPAICMIVLSASIFFTAIQGNPPAKSISASNDSIISPAEKLDDIPNLTAKHCIVSEFDTGRILYEKNAFRKSAMASTTKIMTALIVIEHCDLADIVTVSNKAAAIGGSEIKLKAGEEISVEHLLYGLMLESGNDAAVALAEHTAGQTEDFCILMNTKAKKIGALNTNFTSPHGLDDPNHYTTAFDLSIITKEAIKNDIFKKIVATKHYTAGTRYFTNTNALLGTVEGVDGGKTGFTNNAGRCIVLTAQRNGMRIIAVIFGCPDTLSRTIDGKRIIECIYKNYRIYDVLPAAFKAGQLDIRKSKTSPSDIVTTTNIKIPLTEYEYKNLTFTCEVFGNTFNIINLKETSDSIFYIKNNSSANTICGKISISVKDKVITSIDLIHTSDITQKTFTDYLVETLRAFATILC